MNPSAAALADPAVNALLQALHGRLHEIAPQNAVRLLPETAGSWALRQAMADVVAVCPSIHRITLHVERDSKRGGPGLDALDLDFDDGAPIHGLDHPEDWDGAYADARLPRLADRLALHAPATAPACLQARLDRLAAPLAVLVELALATGRDEVIVERAAASVPVVACAHG